MMKFHNEDGTFNNVIPKTKTERYTFECEELDFMLEQGKLTRSEYYAECRDLDRKFYGDDYV